MIILNTLPPIMKQRAVWARNEILNHPELVEVDYDELLAWIYSGEDNLWYSIDGNYSQKSPSEKMLKREEYRKKMDETAEEWKKEWDIKYYEQQHWSKIRLSVLKRDKYTCQLCNSVGNSKLHIHHIQKRRKDGPDFEDNLITVCPSCHANADRSLYDPKWK